jgi:hypothetical protein
VYNGTEWVELGSTVGINEVPLRPVDSRSYDIMGRELFHVPSGVMYIRNQKLYMKK